MPSSVNWVALRWRSISTDILIARSSMSSMSHWPSTSTNVSAMLTTPPWLSKFEVHLHAHADDQADQGGEDEHHQHAAAGDQLDEVGGDVGLGGLVMPLPNGSNSIGVSALAGLPTPPLKCVACGQADG